MKNLFTKGKVLPFDINGDGRVDLSDIKAVFTGERHVPETEENFLSRRVKKIWSKHEHRFVLLSVAIQKREQAGKSWLRSLNPFGEDKKALSVMRKVGEALEDSELMNVRTDYMDCISELRELKKQSADVKASMSMHEDERRERHQRTIDKIDQKILKATDTQSSLITAFCSRMMQYGIELNEEQAKVLLSRIDAGDITQMASVFAVLSTMTSQFATAKQEGGENIEITKKYYAIYLGLLELQMLIQGEYLKKVDEVYLPGVRSLRDEASELVAETRAILKSSADEHAAAYEQNIASQEFTVSVAEVYEKALESDRARILRAQALVKEIHQLASNTLATVRVSADLLSLMRSAESMLQEVLSLQTPDLIPFENLELQREFETVTIRLQGG